MRQEFVAAGEDVIRDRVTRKLYNPRRTRVAEAWLAELDARREERVRQEARIAGEEHTKLAREANDIARQSNVIARWALAVAVAALVGAYYWR